jgi:PAS domain S-box-containing protein
MMLVSANGKIEYSNQAANELFGYDREELHGKDHNALIPERYVRKHAEHMSDYVKRPSRRPMGGHLRTAAVRKDTTEFLISASLTAIETQTGTVVMCTIRAS